MLTLIIATLGDDGTLEACLQSICDYGHDTGLEVIVVDQNTDERVGAVIAKFESSLDLRHERVPFRGASRARNHGATLARGDWLAFPDDDCGLMADTITQFTSTQRAHPECKVITGRTVDESGASNILRWSTEPRRFDPYSMFSAITEATLFVEAEAFRSVGGFDERFGPGTRYPAAEGVELVNRLFAACGNDTAYYSPSIKLRHPTKIPPFNAWAVKRFHSYAIGDGALVGKSPAKHILRWGGRTLASSAVQMFTLQPWRSAAFIARFFGILRGFARYHLDALKGRVD